MRLTPIEQRLVVLLAEAFEAGEMSVDAEKVRAKLRVPADEWERVRRTLCGKGLYWDGRDEETGRDVLLPLGACVEVARDIEVQRHRQADRVRQFVDWARANPVLAPMIVAVQVGGPTIGLIGGILGVLAFMRSC